MITKTFCDGHDAMCVEAEKTLCELKGWNVIVESNGGIWHAADKNFCEEIPMWARIDADCFSLMAEYGCHPISISDEEVTAGWRDDRMDMPIVVVTCKVMDFPDKSSAIRFSIVMAVIEKLRKARD
jgi:hypothetical protein